ncbi:MAG: DUF2785 domain-containing protein [Deltaproteobacteria bacterium]|nr:DUF2785 domain-containing protein [Deltaproteobacteria bacterium]
MLRRGLLLLMFGAGCATSTPAATPAAPGPTPAQARLRAALQAGGAVEGGRPDDLVDDLAEVLGHPDPALRDGVGYELAALWIGGEQGPSPDGLRRLTARLSAALVVPPDAGEDDRTLRRSFSAEVLSMLLTRDGKAAFLTPEGRAEVTEAVLAYAAREVDYRGHVEGLGWVHAGGHTADALLALAGHPACDQALAGRLLDAVAQVSVRRHGYNLHHGEDSRLGRPVMALLGRDLVAPEQLQAWLQTMMAPLTERSPAFDPALYAAQRNGRNLLVTVFAAVTLDPGQGQSLEAARTQLRALLGG